MRTVLMATLIVLAGATGAQAKATCYGDEAYLGACANRDNRPQARPQASVTPHGPTGHVPGGPPIAGGGTPGGGPGGPGGGGPGGGGDGGGCSSNCGPGGPPGKKHHRNNGFGNGDQDAPGKSEFHNNAENAGGNHNGAPGPSHGKNSR